MLSLLAVLAVTVDACVRPPRPAQPRVEPSREQSSVAAVSSGRQLVSRGTGECAGRNYMGVSESDGRGMGGWCVERCCCKGSTSEG
jgi:hypothetical protein